MEKPYEEEIDLWDLFFVLLKRAKLIIGITLLGFLSGLLIAFLTPPLYRAEVKILPVEPVREDLLLTLTQFLESLGSFKETPGNILLSIPSLRVTRVGGVQLTAFPTTNVVLDRLIEEFGLLKVYNVKTKDEARGILKKRIKPQLDQRSGLLTISVEDRDPQRASRLASRCVEEMENLLKDLLKKEASKRRQIYEAYLEKIRSDLSNAKGELQNFKKSAYEAFLKFYEQAKYEEEIPQVVLQVVDPPVVPEKKAKPKRALIIGVSSILGLFIGVFSALILESYEKRKASSS